MKRFASPILFLGFAVLGAPEPGVARDVVELKLDAATREYCHLLRFPSGWRTDPIKKSDGSWELIPNFRLGHDYEFRVPGLLGTTFLVRGVYDFTIKQYTTNLYEVDLSDPKGVAIPASEERWNPAAVVPLIKYPKYSEYNPSQFPNTGDHIEGALSSPDRALLVVQSWSGKLPAHGGDDIPTSVTFPNILHFERSHGKFFFDVYNLDTGRKLITITATFTIILPEEALHETGWLTERYFLIPLDERRERCLICEFGRKR